MATPQPTTLDQVGKTYSSYFRPDDVKVLATTTNCDGEKKRGKKEKQTQCYINLYWCWLWCLKSLHQYNCSAYPWMLWEKCWMKWNIIGRVWFCIIVFSNTLLISHVTQWYMMKTLNREDTCNYCTPLSLQFLTIQKLVIGAVSYMPKYICKQWAFIFEFVSHNMEWPILLHWSPCYCKLPLLSRGGCRQPFVLEETHDFLHPPLDSSGLSHVLPLMHVELQATYFTCQWGTPQEAHWGSNYPPWSHFPSGYKPALCDYFNVFYSSHQQKSWADKFPA